MWWTQGGSGSPQKGGIAIAGSVSLNDISNTTETYLDGISATVTGDSKLESKDTSKMLAIAGSASFGGRAGIGASVSLDSIDNTTKSAIKGTTRTTNLTHDGKLDISATNDNEI